MAKAQEKYQFLPDSWLNELQNAVFDTVAELAEAIVLQTSGQPPFNKDSHPKAPRPSGQPPRDFPVASGIPPAILGHPMVVDGHLRSTLQLGDYASNFWAPSVSGQPHQDHPATFGPHS